MCNVLFTWISTFESLAKQKGKNRRAILTMSASCQLHKVDEPLDRKSPCRNLSFFLEIPLLHPRFWFVHEAEELQRKKRKCLKSKPKSNSIARAKSNYYYKLKQKPAVINIVLYTVRIKLNWYLMFLILQPFKKDGNI